MNGSFLVGPGVAKLVLGELQGQLLFLPCCTLPSPQPPPPGGLSMPVEAVPPAGPPAAKSFCPRLPSPLPLLDLRRGPR